MEGLSRLYDETVLDHGRRPRNRGSLAGATHRGEAESPLCGDQLAVALEIDGGVIRRVRFDGAACAIAVASASLMTEAVAERTLEQTRTLALQVRALCRAEHGDAAGETALGALAALVGVRRYPVRVQCALLAWDALDRALAAG